MIIYILCFFFSSVAFFLGEKSKNKWNLFTCIGILIPSLVAAVRDLSVGVDTKNYYEIYNTAATSSSLSDFSMSYNVELFYYIISKISFFLGGFPFVIAIYEALGLIFIFDVAYRFRKQLSVWLVMFLYLCFLYNYSLNIMRQVIAVSYLLWASMNLLDRKQIKFWVLSFIGMSIHTSIIIGAIFIYLIFIMASGNPSKRVIYIPVLILSMITIYFVFLRIGPLFESIGFARFAIYAAEYIQIKQSQINLIDLTYRGVFLILLWLASLYKIIPSKLSFPYILIIISELGLMTLGLYNDSLLRIALYLSTFHFLFLSYLSSSKRFKRSSRKLLTCIIIVLGFSYWFWVNIYRGSNGTYPYEFMSY